MTDEGRAMATILRASARAPIGLSRLQVAMSVRAGRLDPRPSGFKDKRGQSIGSCTVGGLSRDLVGHDRLLGLAVPALCEAWPEHFSAKLPLILAMPEATRPDDDHRYGLAFVDALAAKSRRLIDLQRSSVVRAGNAGFAMALEMGVHLLQKAPVGPNPSAVVVGGVDSHHHEGMLHWLDANHRLHARGTENGMVPSEGAGFVLLVRTGAKLPKAMANETSLGCLRAVCTGREQSVLDGGPNLAKCLTDVVQHLVERAGPLPWVLTDSNGERHRTREWMQVTMRQTLAKNAIQLLVAQTLGDTGAAAGALSLAIACTYFTTGVAPAKIAAVVLQSEGPERGAFLVEGAS